MRHIFHRNPQRIAPSRGLLCYPAGGTIDGLRGDHLLFAPSFLVTESELQQIVDLLARSIDGAIA